jgi:hypothetical protein
MSDASGDPLYRSDSRAAPSGAQQADLAPVSDQPSEHWEQQAVQRDAEDPAAPSTDPMGFQPQPQPSDEGRATPGSAGDRSGPETQPAPSSAPPAAEPASAQNAPPSTQADARGGGGGRTQDSSWTAAVDHGSTVTFGGGMAWSDPAGDHVRSGDVSVNLSHATTVGGALGMAAFADQGGSVLSGLNPTHGLSGAEGALNQAIAAAQGAVATVHEAGLAEALDQVATLSDTLDVALDPALQSASSALDGLSSMTSSLDDGLGQAAVGVEPLTGAVMDASSLLGAGALEDIGEASSAPSGPGPGLLASLFTPTAAVAPDPAGPTPHDALPDLDLGGLLGSPDDHPDLGHLGL